MSSFLVTTGALLGVVVAGPLPLVAEPVTTSLPSVFVAFARDPGADTAAAVGFDPAGDGSAVRATSAQPSVCDRTVAAPPAALRAARTLSLVPRGRPDSCAQDFRVDLYLEDGLLVAVGLHVGTL